MSEVPEEIKAQVARAQQGWLIEKREAFFNVSDPEVRRQFERLQKMFRQAGEVQDGIKYKRGPFHANFNTLLAGYHARLKDINEGFDLEFLVPESYKTLRVRQAIEDIGKQDADHIEELKLLLPTYRQDLEAIAAKFVAPVIQDQTILPGVLNEAPYCKQGEDYSDGSSMSCYNAGFRMVYAGVTGTKLHERAVYEAMFTVHGTSLVTYEDYMRAFQTHEYQQLHGDNVRVACLMGADIDMIGNAASRIKSINEEAKVFCVVVLGTESAADKGVWHTNLLLEADQENVVLHDPSGNVKYGQPRRILAKDDFASRWAIGHNRAYLAIAA